MNVFLRAVVTGFGFSLGAALFRKVSDRLGLNDDKAAKEERPENKVDPGAGPSGRRKRRHRRSGRLRVARLRRVDADTDPMPS